MRNRGRLAHWLIYALLAACFGLSACGNEPPAGPTPTTPEPEPNPTVSGLVIQPQGPVQLVAGGDPVTLTACALMSATSTDCSVSTRAEWESADTSIATVEAGETRGVSAGETTITASYMSFETEATAVVTAPEPVVSYAFEPVPASTITVGDTGHFRVNATEDGERRRVKEGVTSTSPNVLSLALEGDRWRYTGVAAGRAEIRLTVNDEVPLQHTIEVTPRAGDDRWRGIRVEPEVGRSGYSRPTWNVRDSDIHRQDGAPGCTAYTRTPITTVGPGDGLDREHIVALAEAWDSRPAGLTRSDLGRIAEDHDNLTLAVASANRSKSDRDAAEWQPEHNGAWLAHRVVEVKRK